MPPRPTRGRGDDGEDYQAMKDALAVRDAAQRSPVDRGAVLTADVVPGATPTETNAPVRFVVVLPYPPSVNRLYRRVGARTLLSAEGRRYEETAGLCVSLALGVASNVVPPPPHEVTLLATPPDRRRRDIDNLTKKTLDVVYRGIGLDDSQIDRLVIAWRRDGRGPCIEVQIAPHAPGGEGGR